MPGLISTPSSGARSADRGARHRPPSRSTPGNAGHADLLRERRRAHWPVVVQPTTVVGVPPVRVRRSAYGSGRRWGRHRRRPRPLRRPRDRCRPACAAGWWPTGATPPIAMPVWVRTKSGRRSRADIPARPPRMPCPPGARRSPSRGWESGAVGATPLKTSEFTRSRPGDAEGVGRGLSGADGRTSRPKPRPREAGADGSHAGEEDRGPYGGDPSADRLAGHAPVIDEQESAGRNITNEPGRAVRGRRPR